MRFRFDLLTLILLNILQSIKLVSSLNCDKSFTYYEDYGQNSFNVSCSGITKGYEHTLEDITINNEISLTITDSVLENITPNIFKNVRNIRILNMFNCTFEFDRKLSIFEKLEKLETLIIKDTRFEVENVTLQGLGNLKRLELSNNSISVIEKGGFRELVSLEKLELVNNYVKKLEDLQLCELKKLKILKLNHNMLSNLKSFHFFCLRNSPALDVNVNTQPTLPNVYQASYFNIATVPYDLIELDLSFNQIIDLGYSLEDLVTLRVLNVGYNKLVSVKYPHFKTLFRLEKLILTNNEIRALDSRFFVNKTQLGSVDLSYNILSSLSILDVPKLQYLNVEYNNLTTVNLKNLRMVQYVNLGFNSLKKLDPDSFQDVPNLVNLNLAGNNVDLSLGLFKNLKGLKYLNLSNNSLQNIPEKVFIGLTNLRVLDLSLNNLETLDINTFHDLQNLETLNLSANSIESLSYLVVEPLTSLRNLDIAANRLMYIEYDVILSKLPVLSNINIKSNQLSCENLGKIIAFLKQRHIVYTNSEHLDMDSLNQNVAGIPCRSAIKNRLVAAEPKARVNGTFFNLGIFLVVLFVSILTSIVTYRFYVYLKRRRYRADEFELVVE